MNERIGVIAPLSKDSDVLETVAGYGLSTCQISGWDEELFTPEFGKRLAASAKDKGITITSFWAGWPGPKVWDFEQGPQTLGIVPKQYRAERVEALKKAGDIAASAGLPAIATHLGFIPENPGDPEFEGVVEAVREVAERLNELGLELWFETGQETPVTMLRLIQVVGTGNLYVNLDPANLILYGKANPVDSLDVFGDYVKSVHAKDGLYPTDPMKLGKEVPVGKGKVDFPRFVSRLSEIGYEGAYIIEREIRGPEQERDIRSTMSWLEALLDE